MKVCFQRFTDPLSEGSDNSSLLQITTTLEQEAITLLKEYTEKYPLQPH
jgi:hypothetical protein